MPTFSPPSHLISVHVASPLQISSVPVDSRFFDRLLHEPCAEALFFVLADHQRTAWAVFALAFFCGHCLRIFVSYGRQLLSHIMHELLTHPVEQALISHLAKDVWLAIPAHLEAVQHRGPSMHTQMPCCCPNRSVDFIVADNFSCSECKVHCGEDHRNSVVSRFRGLLILLPMPPCLGQ